MKMKTRDRLRSSQAGLPWTARVEMVRVSCWRVPSSISSLILFPDTCTLQRKYYLVNMVHREEPSFKNLTRPSRFAGSGKHVQPRSAYTRFACNVQYFIFGANDITLTGSWWWLGKLESTMSSLYSHGLYHQTRKKEKEPPLWVVSVLYSAALADWMAAVVSQPFSVVWQMRNEEGQTKMWWSKWLCFSNLNSTYAQVRGCGIGLGRRLIVGLASCVYEAEACWTHRIGQLRAPLTFCKRDMRPYILGNQTICHMQETTYLYASCFTLHDFILKTKTLGGTRKGYTRERREYTYYPFRWVWKWRGCLKTRISPPSRWLRPS